jgi:hypothetical protein
MAANTKSKGPDDEKCVRRSPGCCGPLSQPAEEWKSRLLFLLQHKVISNQPLHLHRLTAEFGGGEARAQGCFLRGGE